MNHIIIYFTVNYLKSFLRIDCTSWPRNSHTYGFLEGQTFCDIGYNPNTQFVPWCYNYFDSFWSYEHLTHGNGSLRHILLLFHLVCILYYRHIGIYFMQTSILGNEIVIRDQQIWKEEPVICFQNGKSEDLALSKVTR